MLENILYKEIFSKMGTSMIVTDVENRIIDINFETESMLGYAHDDLLSFSLNDIFIPDDSTIDNEMIENVIGGRILYCNMEKRIARGDGAIIWALITVFIIDIKNPKLVYTIEDISARKSAETYLNYVSNHDKLTGLYNRTFFDSEVSSIKSGQYLPVSIIIVDVDGLKILNDTKGHDAGDKLIASVAKVLSQAISEKHIVARTGGDEFTIILKETNEDFLNSYIEKIDDSKNSFNNLHPMFQVEFSLGTATTCRGSEIEQTIKKADEAMYKNKIERKARLN